MNKIKDFIYDKSDIVVAILILFIAAVIILWRFNVILDYPKTLIANQNIVQSETQTGENAGSEQGEEGTLTPEDVVPVEDEQINQEEQSQQTVEAETQTQEQTQTESKPNVSLWVDGKLTATVTVEVKGSSATAAVQCLINKGLYKDYDEYKSYCDKLGLDDEKVAADTFKFKEGTTKDEITKRINWGKTEG